MRIEQDIKLDFSDVLIRPKRSKMGSRKDVMLQREYRFLHSNIIYKGIPIIASNMDSVATFRMATELARNKIMTALHKHYDAAEYVNFYNSRQQYKDYCFYSMGILERDLDKFKEVQSKIPSCNFPICIDVANGYSEFFVDFIKRFRDDNPARTIMAGNVVTAEMVEQLLLSGASIVKCGIGPGSACTTRLQTGVGFPQLSAIIECADAAHGLKGLICADGGCTSPGDVAKAFGAGADFVMLGGMLAGHDECEGEITYVGGKPISVKFYGMASDTAMKKYSGGKASYRAAEGKTVEVPYRGKVINTVEEILGGLRSTCTYVGASELKHLSKCTTFIRVNNQLNDVFT